MTKALIWSDLMGSIPIDARKELEKFIYFSELRTGAASATENRLLETLSMSVARRRNVN